MVYLFICLFSIYWVFVVRWYPQVRCYWVLAVPLKDQELGLWSHMIWVQIPVPLLAGSLFSVSFHFVTHAWGLMKTWPSSRVQSS